jgi:hypothetical protein
VAAACSLSRSTSAAVRDQVTKLDAGAERSLERWIDDAAVAQDREVIEKAWSGSPALIGDHVRREIDGFLDREIHAERDEIEDVAIGERRRIGR